MRGYQSTRSTVSSRSVLRFCVAAAAVVALCILFTAHSSTNSLLPTGSLPFPASPIHFRSLRDVGGNDIPFVGDDPAADDSIPTAYPPPPFPPPTNFSVPAPPAPIFNTGANPFASMGPPPPPPPQSVPLFPSPPENPQDYDESIPPPPPSPPPPFPPPTNFSVPAPPAPMFNTGENSFTPKDSSTEMPPPPPQLIPTGVDASGPAEGDTISPNKAPGPSPTSTEPVLSGATAAATPTPATSSAAPATDTVSAAAADDSSSAESAAETPATSTADRGVAPATGAVEHASPVWALLSGFVAAGVVLICLGA